MSHMLFASRPTLFQRQPPRISHQLPYSDDQDNFSSLKMLYCPLEDGQFRLVRLYPRFQSIIDSGTGSQKELPVRCELYIAQIQGSKETYEALSYMWGDAKDTVPIQLNGVEVPKTRNLHVALEHIRDDFEERTFWIDALCINQEDNA